MDVAHALDAARELGTHASAHASAALSAMDAGALVDADASARGGIEIANVSDAAVAVDGSPLMDAMKAVRAEERAAKIASGEIAAPQRMEGWLAPVSDALEKLLFSIQGQLQALGVPYSTGNAIIIVTILVKAVTFPLTKDQVVSSLNMKNLQPQIAALREKYADDEERMNVEINRAYEENNVNPLAGCGPALLTFPVLAGLYRAFNNAGVDGAFDEAWFFIPSLAGPTDTRDLSWLLPLDSDFAPPIGWDEASLYLIFPVLTTISQFVSMEVLKPEETEKTDEMKNQSVLLKLLPLFIGYISLTVPAGLALYWFWNNVFTTGIQVFLRNGGAKATVEAPDDIKIKIPLGCVVIPEDADALKEAMSAVTEAERAAKIASGEIAAPQRMEGWLAPVSDALEDLLFAIQGQLQGLGVPYSTGNAIIIVTILVKFVTYPLTRDQVVSSLNMKNLQPQIAAIREKYEDDQERMNKEINRVYEENGVNPLAGCGPALLTFPVLAGLYRAFNNAGVDGAFDEAWFFIPSLAGPTDTRDLSWLLPLDSDFAPPIGWDEASLYLIFPILTTISQFVSMEVLKPEENEQTDEMKNQSVLLKLLPLFIGYISLTVPAGLALYWFWNNVFTTGIQVFLRNGGAQATVEAPEGVNIKIPLGCVAIPEDAEFLEEGEEYTGPSIIWNEEWLAEWRAKEAEKAPEYAMQSALEAGMNEEEAKKMEEMMKNRLPRKKKLEERKLATETELKALIREFKGRGEDATVLEEGLVALRAYKAELKAKESDSQPEPVGNSS